MSTGTSRRMTRGKSTTSLSLTSLLRMNCESGDFMSFLMSDFEFGAPPFGGQSHLRHRDAKLSLIFPCAICVTCFTRLRRCEEDDLSQSLVRVNACRQRRRIGNFQRDMTFPLGFQGRYVHDDAAPCIGALADTEHQHVPWNAEILNAAGEGKRVRWHQARRAAHIDKRARIERFRINDGVEDIRKDLEFIAPAQIVAVPRQAIADPKPAAILSNKTFFERLDHP